MQRLNVAALVPYACMDSGWSPVFGKEARKTVYGISPVKIVLYMGDNHIAFGDIITLRNNWIQGRKEQAVGY